MYYFTIEYVFCILGISILSVIMCYLYWKKKVNIYFLIFVLMIFPTILLLVHTIKDIWFLEKNIGFFSQDTMKLTKGLEGALIDGYKTNILINLMTLIFYISGIIVFLILFRCKDKKEINREVERC